MFQQPTVVTYADGTTRDVVLTQWSLGQFAQWAQRQGFGTIDLSNPGPMGIVMFRYQAYCELHRDATGPRPAFDVWDRTVSSVDPEGTPDAVDPTPQGTSEG